MKKYFTPKTLVGSALLVALNIVITRLLSINLDPVRIGFGFLPIAFGSMLYGTVVGTVISVVADFLGALLQGNGVWPGFILSAALYGITYGVFLYRREKSFKNILLCALLQAVFIDTLLGAFWFTVYTGMPFLAAITGRAINAAITIPVKVFMIKYLWRYVGERIEKQKLL